MSTITETFFPTLMEILKEDPSAVERLNLECGICLEKMTPKTPKPEGYLGLDHEAAILPCGHIFGNSCVMNLAKCDHRDGTAHKCPACRHPLQFTPCGCPRTIWAAFCVEEDKREKMMLRVEDIKRFPDECFGCGMKALANHLKCSLIHSTGISMSIPLYQVGVMKPAVKMVFKQTGDGGEWQIERFWVDERPYWRSDIKPDMCHRIDKFVENQSGMVLPAWMALEVVIRKDQGPLEVTYPRISS
ncbi:hypothetical protein FLONG3_4301 [Fusarium longipes]|uniref:RING-type domain-containing protein n=1 Tax=Fusarium longipes TaxID=694270 RepID=A0A395SZ72_9HYPO|nr:hypothetical protein FLONG3_4301 [Fusarium longipes]